MWLAPFAAAIGIGRGVSANAGYYFRAAELEGRPVNDGRYPDMPGAKGDAETSLAAAEAMQGAAPILRRRALELVREAGVEGITADECAMRLGESCLSIRPRFSELRASQLIVDSGARRANLSGRNAVVWTSRKERA